MDPELVAENDVMPTNGEFLSEEGDEDVSDPPTDPPTDRFLDGYVPI